jgi:hypothetical protein
MNDGDSQWIDHWYLELVDTPLKPKFSIGSKVKITQKEHCSHGKIGEITDTTRYEDCPWRVSFDGVRGDVFGENDMELVVDNPWLSKEDALCLCIRGAKMTNDLAESAESFMDFDGENFIWHYDNTEVSNKVVGFLAMFAADKFKLWTPPTPPKPKFTVGDFVVESNGDYWRIVCSEYVNGKHRYFLGNNTNNNIGCKEDCWECYESELSAV